MKRIVPLMLLFGAVILFGVAFIYYQKSERLKDETDVLRGLTAPAADVSEAYEPKPEPEYDPTDLDQTPPGITPFVPTTACYADWGNHLRQYCEGGDNAPLELIEGGSDQAESMRVLTLCLNELLHQIDTYNTDLRPMDSAVEQSEALACDMTRRYGESEVFNDGSIYYMVKEHMESGNISRLEKP